MLGFHLLMQGLLAAPPYNAIPPNGVDGLGSPHFQGSSTGWTALVDDGYVAVFVGRNAEAAQHWVDRKVEALSIYSPAANSSFVDATGVDAALGDGVGLMIFRTGNLAAMSRHKSDASGWATTLHAAIVATDEPWPAEPTLQQTAQGWVPVKNEAIVHLQFSGGQTTTDPSLVFSERPDKLVSWDQWGRAAVATSQRSATSP